MGQDWVLRKVNLADAFGKFDQAWSPKIVGQVNDVDIKLAKFRGEFVWHSHVDEDEMFLVVAGKMRMSFRDSEGAHRELLVEAGEMVVVPRGVEHCPASVEDECQVMLVEPRTTLNTGDHPHSPLTVRNLDDLRP